MKPEIAHSASFQSGSRKFLIPLALASFMSGLTVISIGPLLPNVMSDLGITISEAGAIPLAFHVGRVVGGIALMSLFARLCVARILRGAYVALGLALAAVGLASAGVWSFSALYAVVGLAVAMQSTIPGMWVTSHIRVGTEQAITLVVAPYALATVIAPWTSGILLGSGISWRWILVGEGLISLSFALIPISVFLPDIPDRQNLGFGQLVKVYRFRPRLLVAILIAGFAYVGLETAFGVWFPKFHQSVLGAGVISAAVTVTIFWAGELLGRLTILRLVRRPSGSILFLYLACFTAMMTLVIAFSPTYWVSAPAVFLAGLAVSVLWPLLTGYCSRFPAWYAGIVYTLTTLVGALGSGLIPYGVASAASSLGFRTALALLAVPALVVAVLSVSLRRAAEGGEPPEASPKTVSRDRL